MEQLCEQGSMTVYIFDDGIFSQEKPSYIKNNNLSLNFASLNQNHIVA